ncbi:MAG: FG-GAP-like repeat-containing protein, partial [Acidobacteriota bacterium]
MDFYSKGNVSVLHYSGLKVTDATGRTLPARFEGISGGIRIAVNDANAVYPVTVDPFATTPAWTANGEGGYNNFGYCVATAGDVNGDGYSDVLVGSYGYAGGGGTGKVYLYLGSASGLSAGPAWTAVGENGGDYFGYCVATAGDVNGDGYSDVVVGAPHFSGSTGKVYVYLGSASGLPASPSWTMTGEAGGDNFGYSLSTAGDVNGNGYSDVIIGAYGNTSGPGKVYVYFGGASGLAASPAWTMGGQGGGDNFGFTVATAGDVNGDGYADVIIGAPHNAGNTGKAYLYLGGASGPSASPDWTAAGAATNDYFAQCVATAGDVNGDGYADVIIGEPYKSDYTGEVYLYSGSATGLSSSPSWTAGGGTSSLFGRSVATAGDINGDGYADIIVGVPYNSGYASGGAVIYLGGPSGPSASYGLSGDSQQSQFGWSVATAGDVNGDGLSDVII